jgi:hypothetical protein
VVASSVSVVLTPLTVCAVLPLATLTSTKLLSVLS